jgi:alpha-glucosidase
LRTWRIYPQPEGTPDRHSQFYDDDGDTVDALAGENCLTRLCLARTGETVHLDWQRSGNWQPAFDKVTLWLAGAGTLTVNRTERKTGETIDFTVSPS